MLYLALCDDSKDDLQEIMMCLGELKKENYRMEIMPYLTGTALIEAYAKGRRFNLLVLDMYMEPINGIETARQIRKIDTTVPILIVTSTIEFALEGYAVNAYRYLLKPIDKKLFYMKSVLFWIIMKKRINIILVSVMNRVLLRSSWKISYILNRS